MGDGEDPRLQNVTDLSCEFAVALRRGKTRRLYWRNVSRTFGKEVCEARVRINRTGVARVVLQTVVTTIH